MLLKRRAEALAKRQPAAFVFAAVAFHRHVDRPEFVGLQFECDRMRRTGGEAFGGRLEQQHRPPPIAVEAPVIQA